MGERGIARCLARGPRSGMEKRLIVARTAIVAAGRATLGDDKRTPRENRCPCLSIPTARLRRGDTSHR